MEFSDFEQLVEELEKARRQRSLRIIGVEGHSTSGKTCLAERIGARLRLEVIGTDAFLQEGCETKRYIECLETKELETAVSVAARPLIIEGIALADSLEEIGATADLTVYCKRISSAGLWVDDLLNYQTEGVPNPNLSMVDHWAVEYHLRRDPVANTDLIFRWVES